MYFKNFNSDCHLWLTSLNAQWGQKKLKISPSVQSLSSSVANKKVNKYIKPFLNFKSSGIDYSYMPKYSPLEIHIFLGCQIFWMLLSKLKSRNLLQSRGVCMTNVGCMLALIKIMYLAWLIWRRVRIQRLRTVHSTNIIIWLRVLGENFEGKPFSYHWLQQQQQP